jgi:hypothetical protein
MRAPLKSWMKYFAGMSRSDIAGARHHRADRATRLDRPAAAGEALEK